MIDIELLKRIRDSYSKTSSAPEDFNLDEWLKSRIDDKFLETLTILILEYGSGDYHETWSVIQEAFQLVGKDFPIRKPWDE